MLLHFQSKHIIYFNTIHCRSAHQTTKYSYFLILDKIQDDILFKLSPKDV